ncbi:MAG: helix-turn-helix transcriptional regulator [Lachnospiraceae bacterium]|nr:helix-turn-helix transcriptional regulator [Lachnospiraceae bacterium]
MSEEILKEEAAGSLGRKIKFFREQKQITQTELAEKISVTRQAVSNWERDKTLPDVYVLQKIAQEFDMTIDELLEGTKEAEVVMPKTPGVLLIAGIGVSFIYLTVGGITGNLKVENVVFMVIIQVFIQLFLHLHFSSAVKTGSFSMLAGYDSKVEYNQNEVKKVLIQMDTHIACSTFGCLCLCSLSGFLEGRQAGILYMSLTFLYCADLIIALMFYNYRSIDRTLIKERDRRNAKAGYVSAVWFVAWILLFLGVTMVKFELNGIANNSPESTAYLGWLFLFLLITMAELFYEQHRVKKEIEKKGNYRPGKAFWTSTVLAFLVSVLAFFF